MKVTPISNNTRKHRDTAFYSLEGLKSNEAQMDAFLVSIGVDLGGTVAESSYSDDALSIIFTVDIDSASTKAKTTKWIRSELKKFLIAS